MHRKASSVHVMVLDDQKVDATTKIAERADLWIYSAISGC